MTYQLEKDFDLLFNIELVKAGATTEIYPYSIYYPIGYEADSEMQRITKEDFTKNNPIDTNELIEQRLWELGVIKTGEDGKYLRKRTTLFSLL